MRVCKLCGALEGETPFAHTGSLRCLSCRNAERRAANHARCPDKRAADRATRIAAYPGIRAKVLSSRKDWVSANPERNMLITARSRARRTGLQFDLQIEDIVIPVRCPALGIPLARGIGEKHDGSPSLDRIDNTLGYVRGNITVVSLRANRAKNDLTLDELKALVRYYEKFQ